MYYSNEDVDQFDSQVTADKVAYAAHWAVYTAAQLRKHPGHYKRHGVYWWALKQALRDHVHDGQWYCGAASDPVMEVRADHGSEYRNVLAAAVYFSQHIEAIWDHEWEDRDGVVHPYTLLDLDAPE